MVPDRIQHQSGGDVYVPSGRTVEFASGSTLTLGGTMSRASVVRQLQIGAKIGTTAGWVVNAADNKNSLARCPASQTASTLVLPISGLKVGDIITAFSLIGQIESGGNTCTVDAALRKQTTAVADLTDAAITGGDMTQVSVTADTALSASNASKTLTTAETIGADESIYLLITATTGASTDIDLQGVNLTVTEA